MTCNLPPFSLNFSSNAVVLALNRGNGGWGVGFGLAPTLLSSFTEGSELVSAETRAELSAGLASYSVLACLLFLFFFFRFAILSNT